MYNEDELKGVFHDTEDTVEPFADEEDYFTHIDEDGNEIKLQVLRYFFYNGDEYVVLSDSQAEIEFENANEEHETFTYIMKIDVETDENNEEIEVLTPIDDDELYNKLTSVATTIFNEDE